MSFLLDREYPASFRGANFWFIGDSRTQGRRIIEHEYPGQSDDTEDLGIKTRSFTIQAVIKGFFYEDDKKKLEKALNELGPGILIHPFLGSIVCVALPYTISESNSKVGIANYTLNFKEVSGITYPVASTDVSSLIANLYNKLYDFIKDYLNGEYIAKFLANVLAAAQKLKELERILSSIGGSIRGGDADKSDYESFAKKFGSNVTKFASPNGNIGDNVTQLVGTFDIISTDGQTRFDSSNQFFGFGQDDSFLDFNTVQNNQNVNNLKIINGATNSLALTNMYDSAKNIIFTDQEQLDNTVQALNNNYDTLIDSNKVVLKEDLLDELDDIRVESNKFFNQIRLQLPRIIEIETKPIPLAVLVYQYYGNTDNYDIILDLNNIYNPSRISGTIKMLSES
jgi:prophage DNA circulation protein